MKVVLIGMARLGISDMKFHTILILISLKNRKSVKLDYNVWSRSGSKGCISVLTVAYNNIHSRDTYIFSNTLHSHTWRYTRNKG